MGTSAAASPVEPTPVLTTASASVGSPSPLEDPRRLPDYERGLAVGTSPTHTHSGVGAGSVGHPLGRSQPAVVVPGSPAISSGTTTPSPLEDPRRIAPASSSFSSSYATGSCAPSASSISTSCTSSPSPGHASPLYHVRTPPSLSEPSSTTSSPMEDARRLRHCNRLSGVGDGAAQAQAHQHTSAFPVVAADVLGSGTLLNPRFPRPFDGAVGGFVNPDFSERWSVDADTGAGGAVIVKGDDYSPLEEHRRLGTQSNLVTTLQPIMQPMPSPLLAVDKLTVTPLEDQRRLQGAAPAPASTTLPSTADLIGLERFAPSELSDFPTPDISLGENPRRFELWEDPRRLELKEELRVALPESEPDQGPLSDTDHDHVHLISLVDWASIPLSPGATEDPRRL